jgi:hypothetical protein
MCQCLKLEQRGLVPTEENLHRSRILLLEAIQRQAPSALLALHRDVAPKSGLESEFMTALTHWAEGRNFTAKKCGTELAIWLMVHFALVAEWYVGKPAPGILSGNETEKWPVQEPEWYKMHPKFEHGGEVVGSTEASKALPIEFTGELKPGESPASARKRLVKEFNRYLDDRFEQVISHPPAGHGVAAVKPASWHYDCLALNIVEGLPYFDIAAKLKQNEYTTRSALTTAARAVGLVRRGSR